MSCAQTGGITDRPRTQDKGSTILAAVEVSNPRAWLLLMKHRRLLLCGFCVLLAGPATLTHADEPPAPAAPGSHEDVKIEDRGPYVKGRIVDLSPSTAQKIGIDSKGGVAKVSVEPIAVPLPTAPRSL